MSCVLSLDQSSKVTGYAVFTDGKLNDYGKFSFDDVNLDTRLVKIRNEIKRLINLYSPDEVIFEDIQQQDNKSNNIQTFKILAEVYGVISELLQELEIPHSTILASSWKSILSIKGKSRTEQKRNAQQYVMNKYNIDVIQDIADSICIGEAFLQIEKSAWD